MIAAMAVACCLTGAYAALTVAGVSLPEGAGVFYMLAVAILVGCQHLKRWRNGRLR